MWQAIDDQADGIGYRDRPARLGEPGVAPHEG
jgi:hypothetical protein